MEIYSAHHQHHHTQNLMATAANSGLEQVLSCSSKPAAPPQPQMPLPPTAQPAAAPASAGMERKPRPHPDQALKCPRCESTNTKFCYYNNYSMSQPRYFCKGCRRYWTQGGSLRNVPVGGGCRKNKRSSSSSSSSSSSASSLPSSDSKVKLVQETAVPLPTSRFPELLPTILPTAAFDLPSDHLSLAFASSNAAAAGNAVAPAGGTFLDILRGGFLDCNNSNSHHAYYGGNEMVMPFGGLTQQGGGDASAATGHGEDEATGEKVMMGFQWPSPLGGGNGGNGDLAQGVNMASNVTYWNGGVGAANSWHGLINSSLM